MSLFHDLWIATFLDLFVVEALLVDLLLLDPYLFQEDVEDRVRATRVLVHAGLVYLTPSHALFDELEELILRLDVDLRKSFDVNSGLRVFSDLL